MRSIGWAGVAAAAVAMVGMAAPAQAQRWHRHHDNGGGGFILGALLGGVLVAAATSDHHDRERERADTNDAPPPPPVPVETHVVISDPDRAADACAAAAQDAGQRYARISAVGAVDGVDRSGSGWSVHGTILLRDDYRQHGTEHPFRCSIAGGAAPSVWIEGFDGAH